VENNGPFVYFVKWIELWDAVWQLSRIGIFFVGIFRVGLGEREENWEMFKILAGKLREILTINLAIISAKL
jgi:hypothetical protein